MRRLTNYLSSHSINSDGLSSSSNIKRFIASVIYNPVGPVGEMSILCNEFVPVLQLYWPTNYGKLACGVAFPLNTIDVSSAFLSNYFPMFYSIDDGLYYFKYSFSRSGSFDRVIVNVYHNGALIDWPTNIELVFAFAQYPPTNYQYIEIE